MALAHAILVALLDNPCSGYDLAKRFDESVGVFWDASHQQIYRELGKLEADGHLTAETIEQDGRPNKKIYEVTEGGQGFLQEWMAKPTGIRTVKDDLLVKLFAGHLVSRDLILAELENHRQLHEARLGEYRALEQQFLAKSDGLTLASRFQYLTLRNGLLIEQSWLAWCDEAIAYLMRLGRQDD